VAEPEAETDGDGRPTKGWRREANERMETGGQRKDGGQSLGRKMLVKRLPETSLYSSQPRLA